VVEAIEHHAINKFGHCPMMAHTGYIIYYWKSFNPLSLFFVAPLFMIVAYWYQWLPAN